MNAVAISLHVLAAVTWVGGMLFAYVVLRPSLGALEPPVRLQLWYGVFRRFFPLVWIAIAALLATGYWLIFRAYGGFEHSPIQIHLMHLIGLVMVGLYIYLVMRCYRPFSRFVTGQDWPAAAAALNRIRQIILINLSLGLLVVVIATGGRYL